MIVCKINKRYPKRFSRAKRKKLRAVDHIAAQVATKMANYLWKDPDFQKEFQETYTKTLFRIAIDTDSTIIKTPDTP